MRNNKRNANLADHAGAMRKRLLCLKTTLLSDGMGKTGAMDHDMKCVSKNSRMAGPAATLRVHAGDILMVCKAVSLCPKGSVLVIDGQGELNTALWGEILTMASRVKGLAGVVIDGAVRDIAGIRREGFPVFSRAVVPNAGDAEYVGEYGIPIQCGGVVVQPGDWVVGDEDGVVVVPTNRLEDVLKKAEQLRDVENEIVRAVRGGQEITRVLRYEEVFKRKAAEANLRQPRTPR